MTMRLGRILAVGGLVLGGIVGSGPAARASFTVQASVGGSALAGSSYATLNGLALGSAGGTDGGLNIAYAGGAATVNGNATGQYAAPIESGGNNTFFGPPATGGADTTNYASTGTGTISLTFANGPVNYLGILWGSVDNYNLLTFYDAANNVLASYSGNDILNGANGNTTVYANFTSTTAFSRVVASSTSNSFEIDNVAYSVPEPSSFALCGMAGAVGLAIKKARRRRIA